MANNIKYSGQSSIDSGSFYCPYVPLTLYDDTSLFKIANNGMIKYKIDGTTYLIRETESQTTYTALINLIDWLRVFAPNSSSWMNENDIVPQLYLDIPDEKEHMMFKLVWT